MSKYTEHELDAMYARMHGKEPPRSPVAQLYEARCGEKPSEVMGDEWHLDEIEKTYSAAQLKEIDIAFSLERGTEGSESSLVLLSDAERLVAQRRADKQQYKDDLRRLDSEIKASTERSQRLAQTGLATASADAERALDEMHRDMFPEQYSTT